MIIDFSAFAGQNVILYNDAPAPVPAFDPRYDYYTGDPDQVSSGGAETTQPGYGPNTRTVLQFQVQAGTPAPFDLATLQAQLPVAYGRSQNPPIVPETAYDPAFGTSTPASTYARIQDTVLDWAGLPHPLPLQPKAIQELFDTDYGRMNSILGTELPNTSALIQTTIPLKFLDPPTEIMLPSAPGAPLESPHDGSQAWKITHNGVDTHFVHFHLFDVQVINRVGWDGAIRPPDLNELGWKDTVRMNPLEDIVVAMRPTTPTLPFKVPDSVRALDPTRRLGTTTQFTGVDPYTGQPITVVNQQQNFGWEYVWHCHILGHEENDMMRPIVLTASPAAPTNLAFSITSPASVRLTWTNNATWPAVTSFTVQRATNATFTQNVRSFTSGVGTTYTDSTGTPGTTYNYRVRAENDVSYSAWSNAVTVPLFTTPPAPTNLAAHVVDTGLRTASVTLTWTESASATVTGFTVERATNAAFTTGQVSTSVSATTRSYTFTNLNRTTTYYFRVRAVNGPVTSAWTTRTVTPPF